MVEQFPIETSGNFFILINDKKNLEVKSMSKAEKTHILCKGINHFTTRLQFDCIGFCQARKYVWIG